MSNPFDYLPLWALFATMVGVVFFSVEAGFRLGNHRRRDPDHEPETPVVSIAGATLGLLAFMLAFTFGMAESRYEARRVLVIDEANAIGTTYLRAGYLPEPQRSKIRGLLREYVTVRVEGVEGAKSGKIAAAIARSEELQGQLWTETVALAEKTPGSIVAGLFIQSLNEVIDLHTKRVMAGTQSRIPGIVWVGLSLVSILAMAAMGYQEGLDGKRSPVATITLVLAFSAVFLLVADLDRPHEGWLKVSQQATMDLREKINLPGQ
jgi:hypothetical protein